MSYYAVAITNDSIKHEARDYINRLNIKVIEDGSPFSLTSHLTFIISSVCLQQKTAHYKHEPFAKTSRNDNGWNSFQQK